MHVHMHHTYPTLCIVSLPRLEGTQLSYGTYQPYDAYTRMQQTTAMQLQLREQQHIMREQLPLVQRWIDVQENKAS